MNRTIRSVTNVVSYITDIGLHLKERMVFRDFRATDCEGSAAGRAAIEIIAGIGEVKDFYYLSLLA